MGIVYVSHAYLHVGHSTSHSKYTFAANVADRRRHSRLPTSPIGDLDVITNPVLIPSFTDILLSAGYFSFW